MASLRTLAFLAHRFLRGGVASKKLLATTIRICFVTILACTVLTALIMGMCAGFEKTIRDRLKAIHADITVYAENDVLAVDKIRTVLTEEFGDAIAAVTPSGSGQALIEYQGRQKPILIRAIDPETFPHVVSTAQWSQLDLDELKKPTDILIGSRVVQELSLKGDEKLTMIYTNAGGRDEELVDYAGELRTGIAEIDTHLVMMPLSLFESLWGPGVRELLIKTKPGIDPKDLAKKLSDRLDLRVMSWQDLYPVFTSILMVCRRSALFISFCLIIMALLSLYALMHLYIKEKERDVSVLVALGMTRIDVMILLLLTIMLITVTATGCGVGLSILGAYLINRYDILKLPDTFTISSCPVVINWSLACAVGGLICFCMLLAILIPLLRNWTLATTNIMKQRQ